MKRLIFALLFIPNLAFAQLIGDSGSSSGGGGTFPPTGCATANGIIFNNATPCDSGLTYAGSGGQIQLNSNGILTSPGAATWQFGAADVNGAPVAQTFKFQSALAASATNQASVNTTIIGSLGTGTGTNGDIIFQTGVKTTSGTAQATATTALLIKGETGQLQVSNGTATSPSYSFLNDVGSGFYRAGTNIIGLALGTFEYMNFSPSNGIVIGQQTCLGFAAGTPSLGDAIICRSGAATFRYGAADAAAPVAQTIGVQNVVTATSNTGGANFTFNASKSTGTGVGGKIILQTTVTGTTGSTVNSNFPMFSLNPGSATTSTVQFGDGTNITTYDSCTALTTGATGIVACTASAIRFKELYASKSLNLAGLDDLRTDIPWKYRDDVGYGLDTTRIHVGLFADDVERLDSRCVVKRDGLVSDYEDRCVIAYLVADRQKMKGEIDELRRSVEGRSGSIVK